MKPWELLLQYGSDGEPKYSSLLFPQNWQLGTAGGNSCLRNLKQHHLLVSREPFLPEESRLIKDQGKEHKLQLPAEFVLPRVMPLLRALPTRANSTQHFILELNRRSSTESCLCALASADNRNLRFLRFKINENTNSISGCSFKSPH